jgi:hypothetical protein
LSLLFLFMNTKKPHIEEASIINRMLFLIDRPHFT